MRVVWTDLALRDLELIGDHIAKADPAAAARVVDRIFARVDELVSFPHLGRPGRVAGTRELVITTTPFLVPYRLRGEAIETLAVFHGANNGPRHSTEARRPM